MTTQEKIAALEADIKDARQFKNDGVWECKGSVIKAARAHLEHLKAGLCLKALGINRWMVNDINVVKMGENGTKQPLHTVSAKDRAEALTWFNELVELDPILGGLATCEDDGPHIETISAALQTKPICFHYFGRAKRIFDCEEFIEKEIK